MRVNPLNPPLRHIVFWVEDFCLFVRLVYMFVDIGSSGSSLAHLYRGGPLRTLEFAGNIAGKTSEETNSLRCSYVCVIFRKELLSSTCSFVDLAF